MCNAVGVQRACGDPLHLKIELEEGVPDSIMICVDCSHAVSGNREICTGAQRTEGHVEERFAAFASCHQGRYTVCERPK